MRDNPGKILLKICLILIGISAQQAYGASENFSGNKTDHYTQFKTISTKEGLSSDFVLDIIQDKYHIMWFATANGLTRYDGQRYTIYRNQPELDNSLNGNLVTSLAEDIYGNLWVGTMDGLNRYDRANNCFVRYLSGPMNSNSLADNRVMALYADKEGCLWVKSKGGSLSKLDIHNDVWSHFNVTAQEFEGEYFYDYIAEDSMGNLWVSGRNIATKIIRREDSGGLTIQEAPLATEVASTETSFAIEIDSTLYLGSNKGQLLALNPVSGMLEHIRFSEIAARAGIGDRNGNIWVGGSNGIKVMNVQSQEESIFRHDPANHFSLPSDQVYCLYKDHDGGIWIGTDSGVSYYSEKLNAMRHYRRIEGLEGRLTSNNITALMQDRDGLIWIGTADNGVDTMSLANEKFGNLTYNVLTRNLTREIFQKEKENLKQYFRHGYITATDSKATEQTIFGSIESFRKSSLQFKKTNENNISALYEDKAGNIYVGLWSHVGFNVYNKKQDRFKRYALWSKAADNEYPRIFEGNPFGANWYSGFLEDSAGNFWCATWEAFGLNLFDRQQGKFTPKHYMPGHILPRKEIVKLAYDSLRQRVIIGGAYYYGYYDTAKNAYVRYSGKLPPVYPNRDIFEGYLKYCDTRLVDLPLDFTVTDYIVQENAVILSLGNKIIRHDLVTDHFEKLAEFEGGWTILAKSDEGRALWSGTKNKLRKVSLNNKEPATVAEIDGHIIMSLYEDSSGTVWVGTDKGLLYFDPRKRSFSLSRIDVTTVTAIVPAGQAMYVCCAQGMMRMENGETTKHYPFGRSGEGKIPGTVICNIHFDAEGHIWICTNDGLAIMDNRTDDITVFTKKAKDRFSLAGNWTYSACGDGIANVWVSTTEGFCMLDRKTGLFTDLSQQDDKTLTSRLTSCIMEDIAGKIWIGTTENGISVLNIETDRLKHYVHREWDENSLSDNYINSIFEDSRHNVWVGSRKGLDRYDQSEDKMIRIEEFGGLDVMSIQEDDSGNIWCGTNQGLRCYSPSLNLLWIIRSFPGMQGNEFGKAAARLNNGFLAFGGKYGFNIFEPSRLIANTASKPVALSHFLVNDSLRFFDLNEKKEIKLNYHDNSFSVSFATTDYDYEKSITYRYKLEGFDQDWIYTTSPALTAKYTNIPFGLYTLIIEASDRFGKWRDAKSELKIHIITPWYWRWWAVVLYILLVVGGIILIIRVREYQLRKDNIRLESMVDQRTRELKEMNIKLAASEEELRAMNNSKNRFFSIISHDLRNPLKALNLTTRSLDEQYDQLDENDKRRIIRTIHESIGQTGALLENLLLWVVSQMDLLKPNLQKTSLLDTVCENIDISTVTAKKKGVELINLIPNDVYVLADTNLLSTILRNLISNAINFSFSGSEVTISAKEANGMVEVSVCDRGIGINPGDIELLFRLDTKIRTKGTDKEQGTGLGLIIAREFVHLQGGEIWVESIENIQTIFTFTLKTYKE